MLALIGHLRLLIGMRLHALIFAAIQGVPFVALTYDPKVSAFAREVAEPLLDLAGLTAELLVRQIEAAMPDLGERSARLLAAAAPLRVRARLAPDLVAGLLS
jgi:polysaccharide pyruvyl transferase WcaK-like protein